MSVKSIFSSNTFLGGSEWEKFFFFFEKIHYFWGCRSFVFILKIQGKVRVVLLFPLITYWNMRQEKARPFLKANWASMYEVCPYFRFRSIIDKLCTFLLRCWWNIVVVLNMEWMELPLKMTNSNAIGRYVKEYFYPYLDCEVLYSKSFMIVSVHDKISTFGILPLWKQFKSILKDSYLSLA